MFSIRRAAGSILACAVILFLGFAIFNSQSDRGYLFFVVVFTAAFVLLFIIAAILVIFGRK